VTEGGTRPRKGRWSESNHGVADGQLKMLTRDCLGTFTEKSREKRRGGGKWGQCERRELLHGGLREISSLRWLVRLWEETGKS